MELTSESVQFDGLIIIDGESYDLNCEYADVELKFCIEDNFFTLDALIPSQTNCDKCLNPTINYSCIEDDDGKKELIVCKVCETSTLNIWSSD